MTVTDLPSVNATLNGIAALLLYMGRMAIKRQKKILHMRIMIAALAVSAVFLVCYIYYHTHVRYVTHYTGTGILRPIYFFILITHVSLAPFMVPFSLMAVWFARKGQFDRHTRITKILWPAWMYVSVTGVVIYLMLYVFSDSATHVS